MRVGIAVFLTLLLALAAVAAVERHSITLADRYVVKEKVLQPGVYTVEIDGDRAVLKRGDEVVVTGGRVETVKRKHLFTAIISKKKDGKLWLEGVEIGDSNR
ncbi:MAG TPA: hypothetical protein ENK13_02460, partial [Thermopetrobacter sp.]|nr:hypothetical protein [Thermopetrobacter sp.]